MNIKFTKIAGTVIAMSLLPIGGVAQAQTNSISSTLKNAVTATHENAVKNSSLRNQLVAENSDAVQIKEKTLLDELDATILNLENIQTRIAAKTAETAASGIDVSLTNAWLATSSADILTAQNAIAVFASSTVDVSSSSTQAVGVSEARKLADNAIAAVNASHDDLQSALDALTNVL